MQKSTYSRRAFFYTFFGTGSILLLNSCDSKAPAAEEKKVSKSSNLPCEDLSDVSAEEKTKRQKFGYVDKSPDPERNCGNCSLNIPPPEGKECGGCLLFKGPVNQGGYCIQYAAKVV